LQVQARHEGIDHPAGVIRRQQIIQTQGKQRALTATFTSDMAHNENALGISGGIFSCYRFSICALFRVLTQAAMAAPGSIACDGN
jgi:hypothetical protein